MGTTFRNSMQNVTEETINNATQFNNFIIPEGKYNVQCTKCEEGVTNIKSMPYIDFELTILSGDLKEKKYKKHVFMFSDFESTNEFLKNKYFGGFATACGFSDAQIRNMDCQDYVGKTCSVNLIVKEYLSKKTQKQETINEISEYDLFMNPIEEEKIRKQSKVINRDVKEFYATGQPKHALSSNDNPF